MKLNIKGLALTSGILWGVSVFLLTLIDVPMTARIFGPGLTIATKKTEYARKMPGR